MKSNNQSFYTKAEDNKPIPRITVNLEMVNKEKIKKWTKEEKLGAFAFIVKIEKDFNKFKSELIEALNS